MSEEIRNMRKFRGKKKRKGGWGGSRSKWDKRKSGIQKYRI